MHQLPVQEARPQTLGNAHAPLRHLWPERVVGALLSGRLGIAKKRLGLVLCQPGHSVLRRTEAEQVGLCGRRCVVLGVPLKVTFVHLKDPVADGGATPAAALGRDLQAVAVQFGMKRRLFFVVG